MRADIATMTLLVIVSSGFLCAQDQPSIDDVQAMGFERVPGKFIDLTTDIALDNPEGDELRQLPSVFEKAIPIWCQEFGVDATTVASWHADAYIMKVRQRFDDANLIPKHLPKFPYGFQFGDQMWVSEQRTNYYRRHLLLHEGTHWFMNRLYGSNGPPWIMEGMAEWLGTHRWDADAGVLEMKTIPTSKEEVPDWGRISRIQEQLQNGTAPALETIMQYGSTAHREVDAYAWSWAAVSFMQDHPDTRDAFREVLELRMRSDMTQSRWLFKRLSKRWPLIRAEWNSYVTDLKYGFTPAPGLMQITSRPQKLGPTNEQINVEANRSWQASGFFALAGDTVQIETEGAFSVGRLPKTWKSYADGVTLEYFQGEPVGRLMMCVASPVQAAEKTSPMEEIAVGAQKTVKVERSGELHFRVNEASHQRDDNAGSVAVSFRIIPR